MIVYAGATVPAGYLLCDGSVVSKAQYPELFKAIGVVWGASTSTTFTIPDLRNRFLRGTGTQGADAFGGVAVALGVPQDDKTDRNGLALGSASITAASSSHRHGFAHNHQASYIRGDGSLYFGVENFTGASFTDTGSNGVFMGVHVTNNFVAQADTGDRWQPVSSETVGYTGGVRNAPSGADGTAVKTGTADGTVSNTVTLGGGDSETNPKSYGSTILLNIRS